MVHLGGMVHEGWYMVQDSKLWYDYIIMVRSGNTDAAFPLAQWEDGVVGAAPLESVIPERGSWWPPP